ncbi:MAG TPA: hypothetical protein VII56_11400 [Rhizomicrobium sp.]
MQDWSGFFQAELGAAAALAGLVIVAISIRRDSIRTTPVRHSRAMGTLVPPVGVLVASSCALVPHQPAWPFGIELSVIGIVMLLFTLIVQRRVVSYRDAHTLKLILLVRLPLGLSCSLPFIVGGFLVCAGYAGALYWLVPGIVISLIATVINAWVWLIEI